MVNEREAYFVGAIEKRLLKRLKDEKELNTSEILGVYSNYVAGRGFIEKLITLKIARFSDDKPNVIEYIESDA